MYKRWCRYKLHGMDNIKFVNVATISETKKETKLAKWGEMSIYYVGVYTQRSVYWAEGNQVKIENNYMFRNRN